MPAEIPAVDGSRNRSAAGTVVASVFLDPGGETTMDGLPDDPACQLDNYRDRSTEPAFSDIDEGGKFAGADDFAFRHKNTRARDFLRRPHLPTDR